LKELLIKLIRGVEKKDILKKDMPLISDLLKTKALKEKKDFYRIDSKYRVGTVDISRSGVGFLQTLGIEKAKDLLIEPHDLNGASRKDLVIARRIFTKSGRPKAKVVYIVEKEFATSVVYLQEVGGRIVGINIKTSLACEIAASQKSLKKLPLNTVLKIDNYTSAIKEVLGVLSDPKVDEKISLALYDKNDEFSLDCEVEAKSHGDFVDKSFYPNRIDLTHLPFCTIDPVTAKDFDDAIYFDVKNSTLYVAIADVSEYVHELSHIDKEAKNRGFSIYFPHKSVPMLPRNLSENICSLKPNVDRLAFTCKITLNPATYEVEKEEFIESIICSKKRFTYDEVDEIVGMHKKTQDNKEIFEWLLPLNKVVEKIREDRLEKGFEFSSNEVRMEVDEDQNLISTTVEEETLSHKLIEECMLLANKAAAKMFKVGIFRTHEPPSYEKLENLLDELSLVGIFANFSKDTYGMVKEIQRTAEKLDIKEQVDRLIIRSQQQARYTHENIGHFGLGFDVYTHFTSPIRRYSDLILHRLLKAILKNNRKKEDFILRNIESNCIKVSELERESDKVAWDYMDRKYARWAKERIGETFNAIVTDIDKTTIAILKDKIVGARIFLNDDYAELFENVKIKIIDSDIATTKIIGKIV
jgi:ribonuclease R